MRRGDGVAPLFESTEFAFNESGFALHTGLHHSVSRAHVQDLALMGCKSINIELKLGQMVLPRWMHSCTLHTYVMCAALSDPINRVFLTELLQKVAWVTEPCLRRDQKARHIKQLCKKVLWRIWQWSWREDSNRWKLKRLKSKNRKIGGCFPSGALQITHWYLCAGINQWSCYFGIIHYSLGIELPSSITSKAFSKKEEEWS